jgi:ribosome biogenesis GTPase A
MNQKQTHWYPGHMNKAIQAIHEKLSWIDIVIVAVDARAIEACMHLPFETNKPKVFVITKTDLADANITKMVMKRLSDQNHTFVLSEGKNATSRSQILKAMMAIGEPLWLKQEKKGFKRQPLKSMILGVPNVGKSSLINLLAKQHRVATENRPGSTRGQQWIKLDAWFMLLDTPGILPPKFEMKDVSFQLALIGSMPLKQLPQELLAHHLYDWMEKQYLKQLQTLFGGETFNRQAFFEQWGMKRGWKKQTEVDLPRVYESFIKSFQDGELGLISLPILST